MTRLRALISVPLLLALVLSANANAHAQNATVDLNAQVDVDAGVLNGDNSSSGSSSSGDSDTTPANSSDGNTTGSVQGSAQIDVGSGFSLKKSDATVSNSNGSMIASDSVNTESDLEAFAASTLRASNSIESVDAGADSLRVAYKEKAKFLWFIPFTMNSTVEVAADGTVRVVRPWYSFLAKVDDSELKANLESRVQAALQGEGNVNIKSQARVIEALALALDGTASASATADESGASMNGSASASGSASLDDEGTPDQGSGDAPQPY